MKKIIFFITTFFFCINISYTQPGTLDPSFGNNGIVKADLGDTYDYGIGFKQVLVTPDGSFLIMFERQGQTLFSKRFQDGSRDSAFGQNGYSTAVDMIYVHAVLQADGKIVIAGRTNFSTGTDFFVVRYNADGSLDRNFSKDGKQTTHFGPDAYATAVAIQGDGKIVVAGHTKTLDSSGVSSSDFALARYNPDGTHDKSFSEDGMQISSVSYYDDIPTSIAFQSDGEIAVVGYSEVNTEYEKKSFCAIAMYNPNGSVDKSFTVDLQRFGFLYIYPNSLALQPDGKIVVAGQSKTLTGVDAVTTTTDIFIARYNTDGKLDSTFSNNGIQTTDFGSDNNDDATAVKLQTDGKIVVLGNTSNGINSDFALARYNPDGGVDSTFGTNGVQKTDFANEEESANALLIGSDGKIIAAGSSSFTFFSIAHYNTDGSLDTSFDKDGKFNSPFKAAEQGYTNYTSTAIQNDGKMIAAGNTWNDNSQNFLVTRYNTDGSLDSTFGDNGVQTVFFNVYRDGANAVAIQKDGKIVAAGHTSDEQGSHFAVVRLNTDGTIDSSFGGNGTPSLDQFQLGRVNAMAIQSDGKILLSGILWNGSNNDFGLVRYNTDGQLDNTFGTNGIVQTDLGSRDKASAMGIQSDGKIVVAGQTYVYPYTNFITIRYNTDGSIDSTFKGMDTKVGDNDVVNALVIQRDGKIVVGGSTYSLDEYYYSNADFTFARFNTNGSLDTTFNHVGFTHIDVENDDLINSLVIQRNGKIIGGGNAGNNFALVRLNANGTIDSTFSDDGIQTTQASTSFNTIRGMAIHDNKLYAAGYGQFPGNFGLAVRYELDDTLTAPIVSITTPGTDTIYSAPATIKITAAASDADGTISKVEFYNGTALIHTETVAPYGFTWNNVPVGNYTLTAKATDDSGMVTISAPVKVSVVPHKAPTVSLTNPANNQIFAGPTTIRLRAAANDPGGTISKVEFYNGTTLLRTETVYPYTYTWIDVPAGKYSLTAKATNNFGLVTTSAVIKIAVVPNKAPAVGITNLANYQSFTAPATIPMIASAKDPDGTISKVEFYNGTVLLNTQYTSPYTHTWKDVPAGTYMITVKATDNLGLSKTSAPVTITVTAADTPIISGRKPAVNNLSDINNGISLKAWPNPASTVVNIYTKGLLQNKPATISVISVSGVVMKTIQSASSTQTVPLDVSLLANGVYTIKVTCGNKVVYKQFIKL